MKSRHSEVCTPCPGHASHKQLASVDHHDCICFDGFVKYSTADDPNRCDRCQADAYCPGNGTRIPCPYNIWSPGGVFSGPCIACAMHSSVLNEGNTIGRHHCQCEPGTEGRYTTPTALCVIRVNVSGWIIHIQMAQASDSYMGSADITDCAHSDHGGVGSVVRTMSKDSEE